MMPPDDYDDLWPWERPSESDAGKPSVSVSECESANLERARLADVAAEDSHIAKLIRASSRERIAAHCLPHMHLEAVSRAYSACPGHMWGELERVSPRPLTKEQAQAAVHAAATAALDLYEQTAQLESKPYTARQTAELCHAWLSKAECMLVMRALERRPGAIAALLSQRAGMPMAGQDFAAFVLQCAREALQSDS